MKKYTLLILGISVIASSIALPAGYKPEELDEIDPEETGGYFEGDMMLDDYEIENILNPRGRNIRIGDKYKWKDAIVHFEIGSIFKDQHIQMIYEAFSVIEHATCIRFEPKTEKTKDYIRFTGEPTGCHSKVGHQGGPQALNLKPSPVGHGCFKLYKVVHELIHALGFYHQQSAFDRDSYVKILGKNIKPGKEKNFKKYEISDVTDLGVPYDYGSVMHYGPNTFSKNGEPTIVPNDPKATIGQRERLSSKDIAKLNILYCKKK